MSSAGCRIISPTASAKREALRRDRLGRPQWTGSQLEDGKLRLKDIFSTPKSPTAFLAWLDGAVALKSSLPPDPTTIRLELGQESVAFRRARGTGKAVEKLEWRSRHRP